jgi:hypothetical protein
MQLKGLDRLKKTNDLIDWSNTTTFSEYVSVELQKENGRSASFRSFSFYSHKPKHAWSVTCASHYFQLY